MNPFQFFLVTAMAVAMSSSHAAVLALYNFTGYTSSSAGPYSSADTDIHSTASGFAPGSGLGSNGNWNATQNGIDTTGYGNPLPSYGQKAQAAITSQSLSFSNNAYLSFSITPSDGYKAALTSLTFDLETAAGTNNAISFYLGSNINGFSTPIGAVTTNLLVSPTGTFQTISFDLSGVSFQGLTATTEFRIYLWWQNSPGTGSGSAPRFDNFTLNGTVSAVPEPGGLLMVGLGLMMLLVRKRRISGHAGFPFVKQRSLSKVAHTGCCATGIPKARNPLARRFLCVVAFAAVPLALQAAPRSHLLIFSGQSNMKHLEPEVSVLPALKAAFPEDQFIVVKYAVSGQSIRRWHADWKPAPGVEDVAAKGDSRPPGDMYDTLIKMVRDAQKDQPRPDSVTFFWMQGEQDTGSTARWMVYEESLKAVIARLRSDLGRPDMRFVVGRISDYAEFPEGSAKVREALVSVAEKDPLGAWIDTDDLNGKTNGLHYTPDGYQKLGERFAQKEIEFAKAQN